MKKIDEFHKNVQMLRLTIDEKFSGDIVNDPKVKQVVYQQLDTYFQGFTWFRFTVYCS